MNKKEYQKIVYEWNKTEASYPRDKTIQQLFEEQVERTPDSIAVIFEDQKLTYRELNEKANQLAHTIRSEYQKISNKKLKGDTLIGICMDRSIEMVIAILGILKAGAAYVPIDPQYPQERIRFMIRDCGISLLITSLDNFVRTNFFYQNAEETDLMSGADLFKTAYREPIRDLDNLPFPDRSLIDLEKYNERIGLAHFKNYIPLFTSRGCPYNCAYCHKIWEKKFISRSAENIYSELKLYYSIGYRNFAILDDVFNLDRKNSSRFFQLIIEDKLDIQISFPSGLRGDILTKDYIDLMVRAGTVQLSLALETASPRLQKLIGKNLDLNKFKTNISYIASKHPHVILDIFVMFGFPTETEKEARQTLDFVKKIKWLHFPAISFLHIYPGTDMVKIYLEATKKKSLPLSSTNTAYFELPETLPFSKDFARQIQTEYFNEYFMNKERLLQVLPQQLKVLTEDALLQKYNSYLGIKINSLDELTSSLGLPKNELNITTPVHKEAELIGTNEKIKYHFSKKRVEKGALKILLLDLSLYFSSEADVFYSVSEQPLGLLHLMAYLQQKYPGKTEGKIAKSNIDFDCYEDLKELLINFKPDVIGIRTLSFYKAFFHKSIAFIRALGIDVPIIVGGPYVSSEYKYCLNDRNIDIAVTGEGEITFAQLIGKIITNNGKLPDEKILKQISGIAFVPRAKQKIPTYKTLILDNNLNISNMPKYNPELINQSTDLAYIMYTSGSTGKPKGVMVEHKSVVQFAVNNNYCKTTNNTVVAGISNYSFDGSIFDIFTTLLNKCTLVIFTRDDVLNTDKFGKLIDEHNVNTAFVTTALFNGFFERKDVDNPLLKLDCVLFGGEKVSKKLLKKSVKHLDRMNIIHVYGPTETTVFATRCYLNAHNIDTCPIGSGLNGKTLYILDSNLNPVAIGDPGELYVGGEGLARGYLNRPDLTGKSFIDNPFTSEEDKTKDNNLRLYKTGDVVRWLPDGNIEFIGRNDDQVKLRGFRIELGEVESKLSEFSEISQCIVTLYQSKAGVKQICAYYVLSKEGRGKRKVLKEDLRGYLSKKLPNYMVPSYFMELKKFSLSASGKIDKKALPDPEMKGDESNYVAPRNDLENKLCEIWQDVLGIDRIGINDDFFQLGGNSILAIKVSRQMTGLLNREIPVKAIFLKKKINEISNSISEFKSPVKIDRCRLKNVPLSFAQERLWYLHQHGAALAYKVPLLLDLGKTVSIEDFKNAVCRIVDRHEILRTVFVEDKNGIYYQLPQKKAIRIREFQCRTSKEFYSKLEESIAYSFVLTKEYPLKIEIYKVKDKTYALLDFHHIAIDGWSVNVLFDELELLYKNYLSRTNEALPDLEVQYKDFAAWHRKFVAGLTREQLDYWKNKLQGYEELNFPTDFPRPSTIDYLGNNYTFEIDLNTSLLLQDLARSQNTTLYNILLSAFFILLNKYTGQKDITIGVANANRHYPQVDRLIGFFVNTFARRFIVEEGSKVNELINSVISESIEMQNYIDTPFEHVVDALKIKPNASRHPLFSTAFAAQDFGSNLKIFKSVRIEKYFKFAPFDLTLFIDDNPGDDVIKGSFNYSTSLFKEESIAGIAKHYINLLKNIVKNTDVQLKNLSLLLEDEYQQIVYDWNKTEKSYPKDKTIHQLFEEQVKKTPDNVAVVFGNQKLTYRELNEKANQLAHTIREKYHDLWNREVEGDTLIGIYIDRSLQMIVGILGILKSGAAYVPLDSVDPEERLKFKINDCGCKMVLTSSDCMKDLLFLAHADTLPLSIDSYQEEIRNAPKANPKHVNSPTDRAYVIYTSGSTGGPKGVMVEHHTVLNLIYNQSEKFVINQKSIVLQLASISFDAAVSEIFSTVCIGAKLIVAGEKTKKDIDALIGLLSDNNVSMVTLPPVLLSSFPEVDLPKLKTIIVAGDVCDRKTMNYWSKNKNLINAYGPTEATVCASLHHFKFAKDINTNIGKPLNNLKLYVLDYYLNPVPVDARGELYIGGECLARGYLNRSRLTKQRFIDNPFASKEDRAKGRNLRLYKTGDLVKWLPHGDLEFIGRNDDQIKIRGYRVELSEIENKLLEHPFISQCIALNRTHDNNNFIVAYFVPKYKKDVLLEWWPSVAEYYIYDEVLYSAMTSHSARNDFYRKAIRKYAKNKTVVDIGAGPDVILSRICIEEGAGKVYTIEYLKDTYHKAKRTIKKLGLQDKITLIHGDSRQVVLPEKVDVCVSEILGAIGGSEGAAVILNDAKARHLKPGGKFIPERSLTKIAGVSLPEEFIANPYLHEAQRKYTKDIFNQVGDEFNLRLCIKGVGYENLATTEGIFEDLNWEENNGIVRPENKHKIRLKVTKGSTIYGFLVWLHLNIFDNCIIDCLSDQNSWLPVFIPVFPGGIDVKKGDYIEAVIERHLIGNNLNCDYRLKGNLYKKSSVIDFSYTSAHYGSPNNNFYKSFFDIYAGQEKFALKHIRDYLLEFLPEYMIPSYLVELDEFPLNTSGKIDQESLPDPGLKGDEDNYTAPRNELEKQLAVVWQEILGIEKIGVHDDFFELGGNSILALQLIAKINKKLKTDLKVAQLFSNTTVAKISSEISAGKLYNPLVSFGKLYPKLPNLFMIHPGAAGCEVYSTLANKLKEQFNCFGLDNYNLYNDNKIKSLPELAEYYLNFIEKKISSDRPGILLGWSLGGSLAVKVALLLEKKGIADNLLVLIDPIFPDPYILNQIDSRNKDKYHKALKKRMIKEGLEKNYIDKVISMFPIEEELAKYSFPEKLKTSKVLLFKALNKDTSMPGFSDGELNKHVLKLPFNNVDKVCPIENLTKVKLDCHHQNILDKYKQIARNILKWI